MPVYDYLCADCGPFTATRSMAMSADPCDCPSCGTAAERAFLRVPNIFGMETSRRSAMETNERSRHEPRRSNAAKEKEAARHAPGCSCCSGATRKGVFTADGGKTFPSARPWMISH